MLGKNVILKCPYCKQVLTCNLGVTQYYTYENRKVITMVHCNKEFVCEPANAKPALEFGAPSRLRRPYLWELIEEIFNDYYSDDLPVETIANNIVEKINGDYNINQLDHRDLHDISFYLVKRRRNYSNVWSVPMTEEVEKNLIPSHTICW